MQKKWKLRRVPPELLRWKKDEDITWLYGPFCPSTGANYFSVMEDQAVGASGAATAAAASVLATGKIDTTGDDMPATTTTTTTMDTERALRFRRASTHYANYTSTDRSSLLDDHVAANGQVPSSPSTVSAPLPTTPPAAASAVAASGTTGKRSALKSVHQVWLAELRKFALDMDRRLMVKYPRGRRGSVGGDGIIGTGIMSVGMVGDTTVEPRRVTLGPTTSLPSYPRHRQVDTATAMVVLRETYRSDSDLFQHPTLVSDQHVAAYMAPAEIALLQQMDDGPALNDQQVDDALVDAAASASLSDGQGVPPETQPQQRRNKLRFSAEVEVLEFPTDHGSVGTPTVPGRRSSRSRKISVPVPATSAAAAVAPVVPVPVVASVVPTPSISTTTFSDPITSATISDEPSPPTRPRNTSLVDLLVGMASYVGKLVAPSTSTSTSSGSNSSSDHPQASPRETSLTRPK